MRLTHIFSKVQGSSPIELWKHLDEFHHVEYTPLLIAVSERAKKCIAALINVSTLLKPILFLSASFIAFRLHPALIVVKRMKMDRISFTFVLSISTTTIFSTLCGTSWIVKKRIF